VTYPHGLVPPRRAQLVAEKQDILRRMRRIKPHVRHLRPEYRQLVTNLQAVDRELALVRAQVHQRHQDLPQFFMDAAHVLLSKEQFMEVVGVAEQMQRDAQAEEAGAQEGTSDHDERAED
jgi:hypothetical protein